MSDRKMPSFLYYNLQIDNLRNKGHFGFFVIEDMNEGVYMVYLVLVLKGFEAFTVSIVIFNKL